MTKYYQPLRPQFEHLTVVIPETSTEPCDSCYQPGRPQSENLTTAAPEPVIQ